MPVADDRILERVAQGLKRTPEKSEGSILSQAAAVYGARPAASEATPGTGFDPVAAALFEALVEGAFLVANADGVVDEEERAAFEQVVANATSAGGPQQGHVHALLSDLDEALAEDGIERRIEIVSRAVTRPDHRSEVLRVAALVAHVSGGVSDPERGVMDKLAAALALESADVERAISDARAALQS
jgi:tellurite resistance protein